MEQMFLAVWDKLGTPLTIFLWGYMIMGGLVVIGVTIVFIMVFRMFWKDRKEFF